MRTWNTVSIVGVGLIGGSIGLALRRRELARRIIGIGRRAESLKIAHKTGAVTETTTDLAQGVAEAELVIVCTPVGLIAEQVRQAAAASPPTTLLTDAGSTKAGIVAALSKSLAPGARYVGSHPIAGSEKQGASHAKADLFDGRVVVVTPTAATAAEDCQAIEEFWTQLGATVVRLSPEEHDERLAAASHVPHVAASLLAAATPAEAFPFVGSGYRDTTRVAAGDPELWTQILLANRQQVLSALAPLEAAFDRFRAALERGDADALRQSLTEAKNKRDAVGS